MDRGRETADFGGVTLDGRYRLFDRRPDGSHDGVHLPTGRRVVVRQAPGDTAAALHAALEARDILLRHWTRADLASWLRVTIGTDEDMTRLFDAVDAIRAGFALGDAPSGS